MRLLSVAVGLSGAEREYLGRYASLVCTAAKAADGNRLHGQGNCRTTSIALDLAVSYVCRATLSYRRGANFALP